MAYDGLIIHTIRTEAIAAVVEQGGGVRTLQKYCENKFSETSQYKTNAIRARGICTSMPIKKHIVELVKEYMSKRKTA